MNTIAARIADSIRSAVESRRHFSKHTYESVRSECNAAAAGASPLDRVIFLECARLSSLLADELEAGAIHSQYEPFWDGYAAELEATIRLAGAGLPAEDVLMKLKAHADAIHTPTGSAARPPLAANTPYTDR